MNAEEIRVLLAHGAGLPVDGARYTPEQLRVLAAHAKDSGAQLTIAGGSLGFEDMRVIAAHGKGCVIVAGKIH